MEQLGLAPHNPVNGPTKRCPLNPPLDLLRHPPRVAGVGLASFVEQLQSAGGQAVQASWGIPGRGDCELFELLLGLERVHGEAISKANETALDRLLRGDPVLEGCALAKDVVPGLGANTMYHAGPPVTWETMCGPMRGAVAGAAVFEGWASSLEDAYERAAHGEFEFRPNHDADAVGPMTGIITSHMAVMIVRNQTFGNRAYCTLNEGLGKVMRFGGNDQEVLDRLKWLARDLGPSLHRALTAHGGMALKPLIGRGLTMGDEMHQRNVACTSLLMRERAPAIALTATSQEQAQAALAFIGANDQFFLNVAMAAGKALTDPCRHVHGASLVTAMSRNGIEFGVQLSGTGTQWFTAPVEMPQGLYFPGFSEEDANPDMGDSTIVETIGLGGFAMAAAPAVAGFLGAGGATEASAHSRAMFDITMRAHPEWQIPALGIGVPLGIDARAVVRPGIVPTINTGIAHREPGIGQVGAGVVNAPYTCFARALGGLAATLNEAV